MSVIYFHIGRCIFLLILFFEQIDLSSLKNFSEHSNKLEALNGSIIIACGNDEQFQKYKHDTLVVTDPHAFNAFKNHYPKLTGNEYKLAHYTQYLRSRLDELKPLLTESYAKKLTFHDPCYLGRANNVYEAPRNLIKQLDFDLSEMKNCKSKALCCGAGGAQMFKDPEPGNKDVNIKRTEEALETNPSIIAAACPFCNTMMSDGLKSKEKDKSISLVGHIKEHGGDKK